MPLAPVGGTMCAASPARNSLRCCIGSTTNERIGVTPFSKISPSFSENPESSSNRALSSSQIRSSGHSSMSSSGEHCR